MLVESTLRQIERVLAILSLANEGLLQIVVEGSPVPNEVTATLQTISTKQEARDGRLWIGKAMAWRR